MQAVPEWHGAMPCQGDAFAELPPPRVPPLPHDGAAAPPPTARGSVFAAPERQGLPLSTQPKWKWPSPAAWWRRGSGTAAAAWFSGGSAGSREAKGWSDCEQKGYIGTEVDMPLPSLTSPSSWAGQLYSSWAGQPDMSDGHNGHKAETLCRHMPSTELEPRG